MLLRVSHQQAQGSLTKWANLNHWTASGKGWPMRTENAGRHSAMQCSAFFVKATAMKQSEIVADKIKYKQTNWRVPHLRKNLNDGKHSKWQRFYTRSKRRINNSRSMNFWNSYQNNRLEIPFGKKMFQLQYTCVVTTKSQSVSSVSWGWSHSLRF